jgi:hypothetical protein
MAIPFIDSQIAFAQSDKVGKEQAAQREGAALQKALAGERGAQKLAQTIESVNAADGSNDPDNAGKQQLERLHDRKGRGHKDKRSSASNAAPAQAAQKDRPETVIDDPMIGKHIDLAG